MSSNNASPDQHLIQLDLYGQPTKKVKTFHRRAHNVKYPQSMQHGCSPVLMRMIRMHLSVLKAMMDKYGYVYRHTLEETKKAILHEIETFIETEEELAKKLVEVRANMPQTTTTADAATSTAEIVEVDSDSDEPPDSTDDEDFTPAAHQGGMDHAAAAPEPRAAFFHRPGVSSH